MTSPDPAAQPRFRAVIFDMGDILYDASEWRRWLTEELRRRGIDISYPELVEAWEALLVDVYRGKADYWSRFDRLLREVGVAPDRIDDLTRMAREKGEAVQVGREPMEGVPSTLATLRDAGVRLAVLSDNESGSAKIRELLDDLEIEGYFDAVLSSRDLGHVKPDPRAFEAAVDAVGVDVESCAFVAHDVDELEGAREAGLFAVAYNYTPGAPADLYLDHFSELEDAVLKGGP